MKRPTLLMTQENQATFSKKRVVGAGCSEWNKEIMNIE